MQKYYRNNLNLQCRYLLILFNGLRQSLKKRW